VSADPSSRLGPVDEDGQSEPDAQGGDAPGPDGTGPGGPGPEGAGGPVASRGKAPPEGYQPI
jgi:hypothetical protein